MNFDINLEIVDSMSAETLRSELRKMYAAVNAIRSADRRANRQEESRYMVELPMTEGEYTAFKEAVGISVIPYRESNNKISNAGTKTD